MSNNTEVAPIKFTKNIIQQEQIPSTKGPGLMIVLALVGVILVTSAIVIPVVLSKSHKKTMEGRNYTFVDNDTIPYADKYIDLHLHLDGAITLDIAKKLASLQNITLPTNDDAELEKLLSVPEDCESLNDFLKCFELPLTLLQTPEGLSESVRLVGDNIASQGVVYAEIRYAPQLHCDKGMTQEDAIKAALDGLKKTKLKANLILCLMRGEGNEAQNEETLELAKKYLVKDGGVVAISLKISSFPSYK